MTTSGDAPVQPDEEPTEGVDFDEELAAAREARGLDGRTAEPRAGGGGEGDGDGAPDEPEAELFPLGSLDGDEMTPQKMYKRGLPMQVTASIGKAEVPLRSGMLNPNKTGRVLVSYRFQKNEDVPEFKGGDGADKYEIVGWKFRQHLTATYVEPANDEAALIRREFEALYSFDPNGAISLHAELRKVFGD